MLEGRFRQAIELGLIPSDQLISEDWNTVLDLLRNITSGSAITPNPTLAGIDVALNRLELLRSEESVVALSLSEHRNRLNELRRLLESSEAYGGAIRMQRDRLGIADWLRKLTAENQQVESDPIAALESAGPERLETLCNALDALEVRLRSHPSFSDTLDKEVIRQRAATETVLERLSAIRQEANILERSSQEAQEIRNKFRLIVEALEEGSNPIRFIAVSMIDDNADAVSTPTLEITSAVVERALLDFETLTKSNGAVSGIDRVHTALHGYLIAICNDANITAKDNADITTLFNLVRQQHSKFQAHPTGTESQKMLRGLAQIVDAMNPVRNHSSLAHPNEELLEEPEAMLAANAVRSLLHYLNMKLR
jgi:hypothetical protein